MDEQTAILIGLCEECGEQAPLFDAILYGRSLQMCDKCTRMTGAVILNRPSNEQVYNSIKPSTRDAMRRASGIVPKNAKQEEKRAKQPTLEDMRERARKMKEQREKEKKEKEEAEKKEKEIFKQKGSEVLDEKEFLDYLEGQVEEIKKQEEELKKAEQEENK